MSVQINRRSFVQRTMSFMGLLAISGGTMLLTSCANVTQDIITAFQSIVNILASAGVIPGGQIVTIVIAALQTVLTDVTAYENAPAADKASTGLALATAIQIAQENLQTFWSGLNLTGTIAVVVEGLVEVLLSTLAGFLPPLPVPPTIAQTAPRRIIFKPIATVTLTKHGMDSASKQFRASFDAVETAHGYAKTF